MAHGQWARSLLQYAGELLGAGDHDRAAVAGSQSVRCVVHPADGQKGHLSDLQSKGITHKGDEMVNPLSRPRCRVPS